MTGTLRPAEPGDAHEIHRVAVVSFGPHEGSRAEVGRRRLWRVLADTPAELEASVKWASARPYFVGARLGPLTPFILPGPLL